LFKIYLSRIWQDHAVGLKEILMKKNYALLGGILFVCFVLVPIAQAQQQPAQLQVPNVIGIKLDQARKKLQEAGFKTTGTYQDTNRQEDDHKVIGISDPKTKQNLSAGQKMPKGSTVFLTTLRYQQPKLMPNVVGMSLEKAKAELAKAGVSGYKIQEPKPTYDRKQDQQVFAQIPEPGKPIVPVVLQYYLYREPDQIVFPNVSGMNARQAEQKLLQAGFKVAHGYLPCEKKEEAGNVDSIIDCRAHTFFAGQKMPKNSGVILISQVYTDEFQGWGVLEGHWRCPDITGGIDLDRKVQRGRALLKERQKQ
jgi:hypothetical protein